MPVWNGYLLTVACRCGVVFERWVTPEEFAEWKRVGEEKGLRHVESGPLVRSSYHAEKQVKARGEVAGSE